jgi:hypothetical protein
MQIKEIAKYFAKAGVNVRPKALDSIQEYIKGVNEAMKAKDMDVDMAVENEMKLSNDTEHQDNSQKVIEFVIKRFEELKSLGSNANDKFLEVATVNQIFQSFNLEDFEKQAMGDKSEVPKHLQRKSFASYIKETEDKVMEDKHKEIQDPVYEVLKNKVIVLDSFTDIPRPRILGRHVVYEPSSGRSILSAAESRINYFQTKMKILEDQILKDNRFERSRLLHAGVHTEKSSATCLNRVNAILGSTGKVCCLGMIVSGEDGNLYLEDETMRIRLNLTYAASDMKSYFTEGNIVVVEGELKGKAFCVNYIDHPSLASKATRKEIADNDSFGAYSYVKHNLMNKSEEIEALTSQQNDGSDSKYNENEAIVVLSNL